MKKFILPILILIVILALIGIFFIKIPCGGMTEDGTLWDGECTYGFLLIENIKNGHFFLPFGY